MSRKRLKWGGKKKGTWGTSPGKGKREKEEGADFRVLEKDEGLPAFPGRCSEKKDEKAEKKGRVDRSRGGQWGKRGEARRIFQCPPF